MYHFPKKAVLYLGFAFLTACAIVKVESGKGIGSEQLYAGLLPQPLALYIQSRFGVRPDNTDALVGEQTGPPAYPLWNVIVFASLVHASKYGVYAVPLL